VWKGAREEEKRHQGPNRTRISSSASFYDPINENGDDVDGVDDEYAGFTAIG
jgi:hypothetical protein